MKLNYKRKTNREKVIRIDHFFDNDDDILDPKELDSNLNYVIVFDDVLLKDQRKIKKYFCTARQTSVNEKIIVHSLFKTQKHCIRKNMNTSIYVYIISSKRKDVKVFS